MKIEIDLQEEDSNIIGMAVLDNNNNTIEWADLEQKMQIKICNSLKQFYEFFSRFIKDD